MCPVTFCFVDIDDVSLIPVVFRIKSIDDAANLAVVSVTVVNEMLCACACLEFVPPSFVCRRLCFHQLFVVNTEHVQNVAFADLRH